MCWECSNTKFKVAKNDIKVFKIVRRRGGNLYPYFYISEVIYGLFSLDGYPNPTPIPTHDAENGLYTEIEADYLKESHYCKCTRGFHSYSMKLNREFTKCGELSISRGERRISAYYGDMYIMYCVIPKGSNYAVNGKGEYVSDRIKVIRFKDAYLSLYDEDFLEHQN